MTKANPPRTTRNRIPVEHERTPRLYRLAQVAALLQVHPKTVYYWVRTGRLNTVVSPGGRLHLRAEDARALCKSAGMPTSPELARVRGCVHIVEADRAAARSLTRSLKSRGFDVHTFEDPYDAIVATVREPPEVLVLDERLDGLDARRAALALRRDDRTKRTRVIVWGDVDETASTALSGAGVDAVVPRGDLAALVKALK